MPASVIDGVSNFRDFGGVGLDGGRRLRYGRMFRSAHTDELTPRGAAALKSLGIRTVIDLRGDSEIVQAPLREVEHFGINRIRVSIEPLALRLMAVAAQQAEVGADALNQVMIQCYRSYVADRTQCLSEALRAILACSEEAFLIHCFGGKDRTGVVVFLLLSILGVSREAALDDYLRTNSLWDRREIAPPGVDQVAFDEVKETRVEHIGAFLEEIEHRFGSFDAFVESGLGLGNADIMLLRRRLFVG